MWVGNRGESVPLLSTLYLVSCGEIKWLGKGKRSGLLSLNKWMTVGRRTIPAVSRESMCR